ncbi:hypothetical protein, partial [Escherichia coli]|uniref:hypothetical protein n=1 Tax=Escherichia coli TaxID=562 RepID=UPI001BD6A475
FLYQGLANSYNLSTAKLGLDVGVPNVLQTVARLGINRDWPAYPSMLLGAGCRTPCSGSCAKAPGVRCTVNCRRR